VRKLGINIGIVLKKKNRNFALKESLQETEIKRDLSSRGFSSFTIIGSNQRVCADLRRLAVALPSRDPGGEASEARYRSRWHRWHLHRPRADYGGRDDDDGGWSHGVCRGDSDD